MPSPIHGEDPNSVSINLTMASQCQKLSLEIKNATTMLAVLSRKMSDEEKEKDPAFLIAMAKVLTSGMDFADDLFEVSQGYARLEEQEHV